MVWHQARLTQIDPREFPELAVLTGEKASRQQQPMAADVMGHNFRLWKAVLNRNLSNTAGV